MFVIQLFGSQYHYIARLKFGYFPAQTRYFFHALRTITTFDGDAERACVQRRRGPRWNKDRVTGTLGIRLAARAYLGTLDVMTTIFERASKAVEWVPFVAFCVVNHSRVG